MSIGDLDEYLRRLDDVFEGRIRAELYVGEFEEEWADLVTAVGWAASAKASARGSNDLEVGDVLWSLSAHSLLPPVANQTWMTVDDEGEMDRVADDPDRDAVQRIRAELFRDRSEDEPVPVYIPSNHLEVTEVSLLQFEVPHPNAPDVLVSVDELWLDLEELDAVIDYLRSLGAT